MKGLWLCWINFAARVRTWNPCNDEVLQIHISANDTTFLEQVRYTAEEIHRVFHLPRRYL